MGDMTDMILDPIFFDGDELYDFGGTGHVRCRYCGKSGFNWWRTEQWGWRLVDGDGALHSCLSRKKIGDRAEQEK